jgi:hypothetical protein
MDYITSKELIELKKLINKLNTQSFLVSNKKLCLSAKCKNKELHAWHYDPVLGDGHYSNMIDATNLILNALDKNIEIAKYKEQFLKEHCGPWNKLKRIFGVK